MSPLPLSWVERLFSRMSAAWGAQKLSAMFPVAEHDEVKAVWAQQLGRFEPETISAALQSMFDSGREWPPSLSEFSEACRQASVARRAHAPAVALPLPKSSLEVAERAMRAAADSVSFSRPSKDWARKIIARHERGESVSRAALEMARRALASSEVAA